MARSSVPGMLRTHIEIGGDAAVTAEVFRDPDADDTRYRIYVGHAVVLVLPVNVGDQLADALAEAEATVYHT